MNVMFYAWHLELNARKLFVCVGNHFVIIAQFTISGDSKLGRLILKFSVISWLFKSCAGNNSFFQKFFKIFLWYFTDM